MTRQQFTGFAASEPPTGEQLIRETPTTLAMQVATFLDHGRYLRGWSPHTLRTYTQVLSGVRVNPISKHTLHEYIRGLQARGLTPGGINIHLRTVNSFLTWLHEDGHTAERYRVRLLRAPKKIIPLIPDTDVKRLTTFKGLNRPMRRIHALVLLLLDTGLRISEALTLERTRVDLERRCVSVMGKGSRERMVATLIELRDLLAAHKVDPWATHLNRVISGAESDRSPKMIKNAVLQMYAGTMGSLTDLIISRVNGHDVDNEREANAALDRLCHSLFLQVKDL